MDYLEGEIIPGDKLFTMPSATSYEFGILMSNVHMAWTRAVCGRLKSDYSYSNMIVYNNFPWPSPTNDQKEKIRKCITELKQNRLNREMLSEEDIFQKYMDIAFADISEYLDFGSGEGINFGTLKNSQEVDGTLISEIKMSHGKTESVSVKLLDRMKALDWLSDHMDMATPEQRARIDLLNVQVDRATGRTNQGELSKVDELLMQIKKQAGDVDGSK